MARHARSLLVPAALVAVLAALAVLQVRHERASAIDPLTGLDVSAVRTLSVHCQACPTRRYERIGDTWRMREPRDGPADPHVIERLLSIASAPVRYRHARADLDPSKLGLDPPQATLLLDDVVLAFGTSDAIHGDRYVAVGDAIALVPDRFSVWIFGTGPAVPESTEPADAGTP